MADVEAGVEQPASTQDVPVPQAASLSEKMTSAGTGYVLEARDLTYKVKVKVGKDMQEKVIVHPVNFTIKPRQLMAIMGASGAGKSTLLDILATRIPQSSVDGEYLMNDQPVSSTFKRVSGYVMQDDALYPLLTVRETLQYAALLRIPGLGRAQKKEVVEETIKALKLSACANTIVGDDRHRGVSGGEKRRVSIGVDIVHQPKIIFLDEPTSGLDSTTALQIVETLRAICQRDRTIAVTIHQPSSRVFEVFDKVMFMSKGHLVYNGPPTGLGDHLQVISKDPLPKFANLSELFLEVVDKYEREGNVEQLLLAETSILLHRNFKNVIRTPELFLVRLFTAVMTGLILGSVYWDIPASEEGVAQLAGYIAFTEAFFIFTSLEALPIFLDERHIFAREHGRGAYRVSSFVLANTLVILPFLFLCALIYSAISFYMLGLANGGGNFIYQVVMIFVMVVAANGFSTFISGFVPDALTGNGMGTAIMAFMFLFGGLFINASQIPRGWIWFYYISMFRYPFEGMMKSNIDQLPDSQEQLRTTSLEQFDIEDWNRWTSVGAMLVFFVGWRSLFYLVLRLKYSKR
ncbi:P-loop containing nucleoside triphosphate hydrolase protein [Tribonema minus]|uniref:P-loop containing nucleoside triphosphate hydrolase protein n=1 Tax=Tribonema minus TaxID=303371 RepID=A0A835YQT3_9STRA|nr:P-loop containing nucleoside triphosphate hydrolase protein [Tribonema minus]